jgi:hypothetical protein
MEDDRSVTIKKERNCFRINEKQPFFFVIIMKLLVKIEQGDSSKKPMKE